MPAFHNSAARVGGCSGGVWGGLGGSQPVNTCGKSRSHVSCVTSVCRCVDSVVHRRVDQIVGRTRNVGRRQSDRPPQGRERHRADGSRLRHDLEAHRKLSNTHRRSCLAGGPASLPTPTLRGFAVAEPRAGCGVPSGSTRLVTGSCMAIVRVRLPASGAWAGSRSGSGLQRRRSVRGGQRPLPPRLHQPPDHRAHPVMQPDRPLGASPVDGSDAHEHLQRHPRLLR